MNFHSKGYARFKALVALGCEVRALSNAQVDHTNPPRIRDSLLARTRWKVGLPYCIPDREQIVKAVQFWRPELVWIDKGNTINSTILRSIKEECPNIILLSYSDDDMYARHNRSLYYALGLKYYDVVFTTKSYNATAAELPALGARKVLMVDKAYDDTHCPIDCSEEERTRWGASVGFIGTYERERFKSILFLAENGISVRVWGNGWQRVSGSHHNLKIEGRSLDNLKNNPLYTKAICCTKINLGFLRKKNRDLHTDRSIEIPACGGFMLAERSTEHQRLFTEGHEAEFFSTNDELLEKTKYYLTHEVERAAIGHAGRRRCIENGYSQLDRVRFMLSHALNCVIDRNTQAR